MISHRRSCLHDAWSLGQNSILSWSPLDDGVLVLVVPHYAIAEYTAAPADDPRLPQRVSARFITELISGDRRLTLTQMQKVSRLLDVEPRFIALRQPLSDNPVETQIIEKMIRRYGRYCRLQPVDAVRANDAAQQLVLFPEFRAREDARTRRGHQFRALLQR
jgi:hypothetical protein